MVTPQHEPTTADELALSQRLVIEVNKLLAGRTTAQAVSLLMAINEGMAAQRAEQVAATVETITVHQNARR